MLFKLIALVVMAHHINACCMPSSYQFTGFSETHVGDYRYRVRFVVAADNAAGMIATSVFSEHGQTFSYVDLKSRNFFYYTPSQGCHRVPMSPEYLSQVNNTRCLPLHLLTDTPVRLTLAGGVNATLYSGRVPHGNATLDSDAVIADRCQLVFYKVSGKNFNSISMFGDFQATPQPSLLELPEECRRNATSSGKRKREMVHLGFGANPFMF